jgi:Transposase
VLGVLANERAIRAWCKRVQASGLHYFDRFLTTLERWIDEITTYFDDRQTSGFVEGFNNRFEVLKRRCYGIFRCEADLSTASFGSGRLPALRSDLRSQGGRVFTGIPGEPFFS